LHPIYELDKRLKCKREIDVPPSEIYIPLGYDREPGDKKKHFRKFFSCELETLKEYMGCKPFETYDIKAMKE